MQVKKENPQRRGFSKKTYGKRKQVKEVNYAI